LLETQSTSFSWDTLFSENGIYTLSGNVGYYVSSEVESQPTRTYTSITSNKHVTILEIYRLNAIRIHIIGANNPEIGCDGIA